MKCILKKALAASALASLALAGAAGAQTDTTSVAVSGGSAALTAPTFGDFTATTLTGSSVSKTAAVTNWSVNDARGTGAGWEVAVAASPLTTGGTTPVTMTGATMTLTAPTVSPVDTANTSIAPTVAGGNLLAGTVKVADANANEGLGAWSFAQTASALALVIPANARVGTYTSTITTTFTPGI